MMIRVMLCLAILGCGQSDYGPDAGIGYVSDALCIDGDQSTGSCPGSGSGGGTNGGGGGDAGTAVQLCEASARDQCCNIGFCGNAYCVLVFAQGCSSTDQQSAIDYCHAHPEIRHDADCHPQW